MKQITCKECNKTYPKAAMENKDYCSTECIINSRKKHWESNFEIKGYTDEEIEERQKKNGGRVH